MFRDIIKKALQKVTGLDAVQVDVPGQESFGDYSSNVAMQGEGKLKNSKTQKLQANSNIKNLNTETETLKPAIQGLNPRKRAEELVEKLQKDKELMEVVEKIEIAGPGFLNFWIRKDVLVRVMEEVLENENKQKTISNKQGKKIMVEFAHPNTHKAFHIGHLRNITTGESLIRLMEATDTEVIRANYQGDVGPHIAKSLWGIKNLNEEFPTDIRERASFLGKAYVHGNARYEEDEKVKEEILKINKLLYEKDDNEWTKLYKETRQWSLDYFNLIYKRVGSHFDRLYFESEAAPIGVELAKKAKEDGILIEGEGGAIVFEGEKYGSHTRVFITGKRTPTYEGKDLGLAKLQFEEYNPDCVIHVLGPEQLGYTEVLFKALEFILPYTKGRELHLPYGFVRLKEGKMSSRKGNVVLGEQLLDDAKNAIIKAYKTPEDVAEQIAVGAVKYSFLKVGINHDIAFDLKESISLEGNSGPYLQYTYARAKSVLVKSKSLGVKLFHTPGGKLEAEELSVLRTLSHFTEVLQDAAETYSPNLLANYLYDLAQKFNTFYNKHRILEAEGKSKYFRLALTQSTSRVLQDGLHLLGIETPEKM